MQEDAVLARNMAHQVLLAFHKQKREDQVESTFGSNLMVKFAHPFAFAG